MSFVLVAGVRNFCLAKRYRSSPMMSLCGRSLYLLILFIVAPVVSGQVSVHSRVSMLFLIFL